MSANEEPKGRRFPGSSCTRDPRFTPRRNEKGRGSGRFGTKPLGPEGPTPGEKKTAQKRGLSGATPGSNSDAGGEQGRGGGSTKKRTR